jgi:hypothetical protein
MSERAALPNSIIDLLELAKNGVIRTINGSCCFMARSESAYSRGLGRKRSRLTNHKCASLPEPEDGLDLAAPSGEKHVDFVIYYNFCLNESFCHMWHFLGGILRLGWSSQRFEAT